MILNIISSNTISKQFFSNKILLQKVVINFMYYSYLYISEQEKFFMHRAYLLQVQAVKKQEDY